MSTVPGIEPPCPRCGRIAAPVDGPFCRYCGRYRAASDASVPSSARSLPGRYPPLRWVAERPPAGPSPAPPRWRPPYSGAPRYRYIPRWGFPARAWVPAPPAPPEPDPLRAARSLLGSAVPLLWATAAVSFIAAGAEVWRYVLLLASRDGALSAGAVGASDALVATSGTIAPVIAAVAGVLVVLWTLRATAAAAARAGVVPARTPRELVLGWVVPGLNLSVPGSALAEIEHAALDRPCGRRPRPSRLLVVWWALWASSVLLAAAVLLWSLRTGVQALADGVVLHAVLDLLAAVTAGVTAVLLTRLTRLLGPARAVRREVLVRVGGGPSREVTVPVSSSPTAPAGPA